MNERRQMITGNTAGFVFRIAFAYVHHLPRQLAREGGKKRAVFKAAVSTRHFVTRSASVGGCAPFTRHSRATIPRVIEVEAPLLSEHRPVQ